MAAHVPATRYVLEGRLVTMGPAGVIEDGAVYVDGGVITAVLAASDPAPDPMFDGVPRIRTGDTVYPGMIELHNHLSYNAMPLWDVPQRYTNNGQWRGSESYTRDITKPSQVLGQTDGVVQALVRYVECRALLGGVTTSQGITLAQASGITKYYRGLIRNVEQPLDDRLPAAGTNIANPDVGGAASYLSTKLAKNTCYLQHLSEGTDATARGWFLRLNIDGDRWAVNDVLCAIHATSLGPDDYAVLADRGATMVWSPLSNYLLYGATADIAAAKGAGMRISLGCDWAPSGSKNLLGELKVASLVSRHHGDVFTPEELVEMVTVNPAKAAKWDHMLGTIEAGKLADLMVVNGRDGDPFTHLVEARETSITLVVIDGTPRVGQPGLMARFWDVPAADVAELDHHRLGRSDRYVYAGGVPDADLLAGLSLSVATATLADAMEHLPELAGQVDAASATAVAAGEPVVFAGGMADDMGTVWRVVPDFEQEDIHIAAEAAARGEDWALAAEPYAYWVTQRLTLDPITVVEDPGHLRTLVAAPNLPEFVKKGLPPLYGEVIPLPDSASFIAAATQPVADEVRATTQSLGTLLRTFGELTLAGRRTIVDQALLLLTENYVHLPLKRAMHGVDPVQRLRLLRHRMEEMTADSMPHEIEFHAEVTDIFNSVRDLHTGYRLPAPFGTKVAWLPFLVEEVDDRGTRRYILTKWVADAWPDPAMQGADVTHWNGMPIEQAVARNAERHAGSNPDARHARGLNALTVRPLARGLPPDEDWVTVTWRDGGGGAHEHTQEWLVFEPGTPGQPDPAQLSALGVDDHTDDVQQARKLLYAPAVAAAERRADARRVGKAIRDNVASLASHMPGVFRALEVRPSSAAPGDPAYGYIRIFTFSVQDADEFVAEFVRLAEQLPPNGLVIDVRGNGGGLIYAAEQLLEVLTPAEIERERAQFICTPLNLAICRHHADTPGLGLGAWVDSLGQAVRTGATYSLGFPITPDDAINRVGQRYYGPVVLVTDPLCYSATDMFAAGFQDHGIGKVVGVGGATGAGGANVWSHQLLRLLLSDLEDDASPYIALPGGADMRVAIRRTTRVGARAGDILEDLGVVPDVVYRMTRRDVMGHNEGLIDRAIRELSATPRQLRISSVQRHRDRAPTVTITTANLTRIDAEVNHRRLASRDVVRNTVRIELGEVVAAGAGGTASVLLLGFDGDELVAERREEVAL